MLSFRPFSKSLLTAITGAIVVLYVVSMLLNEQHLILISPWPAILMCDLNIYLRAAREALSGMDPYHIREIGIAFVYPPPALFLLTPLALLPQSLQFGLFALINVLLMGWIVYSIQCSFQLRFRQVWLWYVLAFCSSPFIELMTVGQINLITLAGIVLLFRYEKSHPMGAAAGLALAVITKLSPVIFLGYLIARRSYRVLLYTTGMILALCLFAGLAYGFDTYTNYAGVLGDISAHFQAGFNAQGFVSKLEYNGLVMPGSEAATQRLLTLYFGAILLLSGLLSLRPGLDGEHDHLPLFMVTLFSMNLYPNVMWYHHYVFLLLPLLIMMAWSQFKPWLVAWVMIFLLLTQIDRYHLTSGLIIHLFGHLTIWGLLFYQVRDLIRTGYLKSYQDKFTRIFSYGC